MAKSAITCPQCGAERLKENAEINRAARKGVPLYCGRACANVGRRTRFDAEGNHLSPSEWAKRADAKAAKAEYDRERRARLGEALRKEKRDAYYRNHEENLRKQAIVREQRRQRHAENPEEGEAYRAVMKALRERPEWKRHKRDYDRRYRAKRMYGDFGGAHVALMELSDEINARTTFTERAISKGTLNKSQQRRREWEKDNPPT